MTESTAEFNYEGSILKIHCNPEEKMEDIIKRFKTKTLHENNGQLYFMYNGRMINENLSFKEQANENDKKRNTMSILVYDKISDNGEEGKSLKKSKYIICPQCQESARILIDDYKIEIYDCKNGHKIDNIKINDFEKAQKIDEAKIICQNCNKVNKSTSYNNTFFTCYDCQKNLCRLCESIHDKSHNIIDYEDKFFTCNLHYESYYAFCMDCKKDICLTCDSDHKGHNTICYGSILPNQKKIKEDLYIFADKKNSLKNQINNIIYQLNQLSNENDQYYKLCEDIINSYGNKRRNYFLLQNIQEMIRFKNNNIEDIKHI